MHDQRIDLKVTAQKLADMFITLQRSFVMNLSTQLGHGNVSFPQFLLLGFLEQEKRPMTMTETAKKMRHTTAAATGLVDRLVKLGLAKRQQSPTDRRKVFVHITTKGVELLNKIRQDMVQNLLRLMGYLEESEQAAWLRIYEKIFPHCEQ